MEELEPSPVDSPASTPSYPTNPSDIDPEKDSYFRPNAPQRSTTNSLGLTPSRTLRVLSALQKYSTVPPSIYLLMHYANTAIIPLVTQSLSISDDLLLLTRPYYQSFPLEPLLIFAPVATHVISGISLRLYRRRQSALRHGAETHSQRKSIAWPKLSLTSALGYALYPMLAAHILVNRITPLKVEGNSSGVGLRYFAHGIARHPLLSNLGYSVMLCVASWHFVGGAAKYLKLSREYVTEGGDYGNQKRKRRGWIINGMSGLVAALWIAGGLGVIGRGGQGIGWEASNWEKIYKSVPVVGQWM